MTTKDNGGPAFPARDAILEPDNPHDVPANYPGMTLRDWFAGQALAGLMADTSNADPNSMITEGQWAKMAYLLADAMIAERSK